MKAVLIAKNIFLGLSAVQEAVRDFCTVLSKSDHRTAQYKQAACQIVNVSRSPPRLLGALRFRRTEGYMREREIETNEKQRTKERTNERKAEGKT